RFCPALPADTALDVAMTVMSPVAAATLKSIPSPALRNGTRKTPPPMPSSDPSAPATDPATTTATMGSRVRVYDPEETAILSHVPALLRRRTRSGVVPDRMRSHESGGRDRSAARRVDLYRGRGSIGHDDRRIDRDARARRLRFRRA